MQQPPANTQIKVGDEVQIFGYGLCRGEEPEDCVHLFSGEHGKVKKQEGMMLTISLDDPEDVPQVEVHYYQLVPKKNLI